MDHRVEINHLSPKASYMGPEGLPKEENEQQNLLTATADEVLLPTHLFILLLYTYKSQIQKYSI